MEVIVPVEVVEVLEGVGELSEYKVCYWLTVRSLASSSVGERQECHHMSAW